MSSLPTAAATVRDVMNGSVDGGDIVDLAVRLGLVATSTVAQKPLPRRQVPTDYSKLSEQEVSDWYGYWTSETARLTEVTGLFRSQERLLSLERKQALARARSRLRRDADSEGRKVTATAVNDDASADPHILELDERITAVEVLIIQAEAAREASTVIAQALSREITFRTAHLNARVW